MPLRNYQMDLVKTRNESEGKWYQFYAGIVRGRDQKYQTVLS